MSVARCEAQLLDRIRFGRFELQPAERRLLFDGHPAAMGSRAFNLLQTLIERRNRLVTKAELLDLVWPGLVVEEGNLAVQVSGLRKLIGAQAIATVPGLGYRFAMSIDGDEVAAAVDAGPSAAPALRTNVPLELDVLLGRDSDVAALPCWLAEHRLVTVLGAGGIGKTRVAQAVARVSLRAFADGVWWVDLAALSSAEKVAPAIAAAAGLQLGDGDASVQLARALASRATLLVLDNCEHLASAVATLVREMLASAAGVQVLATSQEALRINGEHVYLLSPLAVPPVGVSLATAREFAAVQLLEHRAKAADPRFALTDASVDQAVDLCRQLDGVALAIEMAAARLPLLGVEDLRKRLGDRLRVLRAASQEVPSRQRTLRATLDWSHELLDANERAVLRRLSVFAGSFRLDAAQRTAAMKGLDADDVIDALAGLVDKSLINVEQLEPPRYRLAETTRLYALEKLRGSDEEGAARRSHATYVREFLEDCFQAWLTTPELVWRRRVAPELDDVRAGLHWSAASGVDATEVLAMASASMPVWLCHDALFRAEGVRIVQQALSLLDANVPVQIEARLWFALALLLPYDQLTAQLAALEKAMKLCRTAGERQPLCHSLVEMARVLLRMGRTTDAGAALDEAEATLERSAPSRLRGLYFMARGTLRQSMGDLTGASALHGLAADLLSGCGADSLAICATNDFADALWAQGDLDGAIDAFSRTVELARKYPFSDSDSVGVPLGNWAAVLLEQGHVEQGYPSSLGKR